MEKVKKEKAIIKEKNPGENNVYIYKGDNLCLEGYVFKTNSLITEEVFKIISQNKIFKEYLKNFVKLGGK